ncbi:hypothetical protein TWF481_000341 [Arthrobotrys musiformis]|uniref:Fucose-specific lectin n=1 Tax=Arthrobotrys musiformis TaxID=47236 RepID=A0AAV9WMC0_9PEZI
MSTRQFIIADYTAYKLTTTNTILHKRITPSLRPDLEDLIQFISTPPKSPSEIKSAASKIEHRDLPQKIKAAREAGNTHHAAELQAILDAAAHGDTDFIVHLATNLSKTPTEWGVYHHPPTDHKISKIWVDAGNLYQLRRERGHSTIYSLSGHQQLISSIGNNDIIGRGKLWLKVNADTNDVEWHGEHDSKNVWQFGIERPRFPEQTPSNPAEAKKHLLKSSGPEIYHVTENEGIVEYNLTGRNPRAEFFGSFGAGDCESATGWSVHDSVVYWIIKDQLVCSSKEVNEVRKPYDVVPWRIYDGSAGCFVVAVNGFIFVYNREKKVIEWTKTVKQDRMTWGEEKPVWEKFENWDGDNVDELVISAGAADNAHVLGVRDGDDIKFYSIEDVCKI